jgi:arylsulfatase A-like enzyme
MRAIVFALRGCPAGWLGAYGNEWVGTPHLDRLASEGVVFDRHLSDSPDPDAARAAWLTGRPQIPSGGETPAAPQATEPGEGRGLPPPGNELLSTLRATGVRTVLVRANHPDTDAAPPFYAGWDEVFDARPRAEDDSPLDALIRSLPSVLDRLGQVPRWLVWVETDRLVPPWDVRQDVFEAYIEDPGEEDEPVDEEDEDAEEPDADEPDDREEVGDNGDESDEEESAADDEPAGPVTPWADPPTGPFDRSDLAAWEWLHRTFAAVVTSLDAELGAVFEELRTRGLDQTAVWLVTSDLGYPLGEHGQVGLYRPWLHEELVHLPLVVRLPGAAEAGRRVPAFTQPADLFPTLLALFGAEPPREPVHGHDLLPLLHGQAKTVREYACSGLALNGAAEWSIRTPDAALLLPGPAPEGDPPREPMLFEKPDDRWEVNDLRPRSVERAEQLEELLRKSAAAAQHPGALVTPELAADERR